MKKQRVAIVGITAESLNLARALLTDTFIEIIKVINPVVDPISELLKCPDLEIIIDASNDPGVSTKLRNLPFDSVDILNPLSARILLCSSKDNSDNSMAKLLRSLRDIAASVRLAKDKNEILKLILNLAINSVGADSGSIMLVDKDKRYLKIEITQGIDNAVALNPMQKIGTGVSGVVAKSRRPVLLQGLADPKQYRSNGSRREVVSAISSPLVYGENLVGVLNVNSKRQEKIFSEQDVTNVNTLSEFTAEIIQSSCTYVESSTSSYSLSLYNTIRDILTLPFSFEERLHLAVMKISNTLNAETCNVYEYNAESNSFISRAASSYSVTLTQGETHCLHDFFAKQIVTKRHRIIHSIDNKTVYFIEPVFVEGEIWGALLIHFQKGCDNRDTVSLLLEKVSKIIAYEINANRQITSAKVQALKYSAMAELIFELTVKQSFDELVSKILSNGCFIMDAETCIIRKFDKTTNRLVRVNQLSSRAGLATTDLDSLDSVISKDAMYMSSSLFVRDFNSSPYRSLNKVFTSAICAPLRSGEKLIGTISVYDKKAGGKIAVKRFSDLDKMLFSDFAIHVGKAASRCLNTELNESDTIKIKRAIHVTASKYVRPGLTEYIGATAIIPLLKTG